MRIEHSIRVEQKSEKCKSTYLHLDKEIWFDNLWHNIMTDAIFVSTHKDKNRDELQPRLDNFLDN